MKKVVIVHTSFVSVDDLKKLFAREIPEAQLYNIVDDSLLAEVSSNGAITPGIVNRMCKYFDAAQSLGADLIFNQCSSVGEAADIAAKTVSVPVIRVDEAMAEEAVRIGKRIGVVATVASTMKPSCNLIRTKAKEAGKEVEVVEYLVDGALDVLMKEGNREKHNRLVLEAVKQCEAQCDVIVLAQGSMTVLLPELSGIKKPVLTSPERGVRKAKSFLQNL